MGIIIKGIPAKNAFVCRRILEELKEETVSSTNIVSVSGLGSPLVVKISVKVFKSETYKCLGQPKSSLLFEFGDIADFRNMERWKQFHPFESLVVWAILVSGILPSKKDDNTNIHNIISIAESEPMILSSTGPTKVLCYWVQRNLYPSIVEYLNRRASYANTLSEKVNSSVFK